eukprot:scaffold95797_cov28-Tisochrysis_lutea.AAC.1
MRTGDATMRTASCVSSAGESPCSGSDRTSRASGFCCSSCNLGDASGVPSPLLTGPNGVAPPGKGCIFLDSSVWRSRSPSGEEGCSRSPSNMECRPRPIAACPSTRAMSSELCDSFAA